MITVMVSSPAASNRNTGRPVLSDQSWVIKNKDRDRSCARVSNIIVPSGTPIRRVLTLTRLALGRKVPPPLFSFSLLIHFPVVPGAAPWLSPGRRLRIPQVPPLSRSSISLPSTKRLLRKFEKPSTGFSASQAFILGNEVNQFETEAASYCDAREAIGCASGTDALLLALMALDIGPGDEVVTSPFTFFATASTIHRAGRGPSLLTSIRPR